MKKFYLSYFFIFFLLTGCQPEKNLPKAIRPIRYEQGKKAEKNQVRIFPGLAKAKIETHLSFRNSGQLQDLWVKTGDFVEKEALLAAIEPQDYILFVEEAEAALYKVEAEKKRAFADYFRAKELYETDSISLSELDAAKAVLESSKALYDAARTKQTITKTRLSYSELKAPVEGKIGEVFVKAHENVKAGQPILLLTSIKDIDVTTWIPESFIGLVEQNDLVVVRFDALKKEYPGFVREIGVISTKGTTFPVTIEIKENDPEVLSGMSAEVVFSFINPSQKNCFILPSHAIFEKDGKSCVFVAIPQKNDLGMIKKKIVETGNLIKEGIEIISGLEEDDLVVTAGIQSIEEKQIVRLKSKKECE